MGAGLQIFNESGVCVLDTSDRLGKILGSIEVNSNGSLNVPGQPRNNQVFCLAYDRYVSISQIWSGGLFAYTRPNVVVSGNAITWTYPYGNPSACVLVYGVY